MAEVTRVNGAGSSSVGTLYGTAQLKAYFVTLRSTSNGSNTAIDLRSDDGVVEGKVEQIMRELSPLMYFVTDSSAGTFSIIVDGHANNATSIAERLESLSGVGTDTAVTLGTSIVVS
jgi:hypothetical protein